ncbi:hypothetical protein DLM76_17155 [Leptospira yasudae]|uniref:hypothetical protein n=1 Tax=Leptospira yasudae TaxID=2202201 RepID=UPI000E59D8D7|nr:hypothetical protein [Leptospira yasudae]RHX91455.1 hypothetical protein DLM76_17155 [Leptospira yasudae]
MSKFLDEIIEEEFGKLFRIVKSRIQEELENGIRNASASFTAYLTQGQKQEGSQNAFQFIQCEKCKRYHFEDEKHVCNVLRGNRDAESN